MKWGLAILAFILLRSNSAGPGPANRLQNYIPLNIPTPVPQGSSPSADIEIHNPNVTQFGGGVLEVPLANGGGFVNLPYQARDPNLPASSKIGLTFAQQTAQLADGAFVPGGSDATFGADYAADRAFE